MSKNQAVIVTTTLAKTTDDFRLGLAQKTVRAAVESGYEIIVVDDSPIPEVAQGLRALGATVYEQREPGMGNSRRQAFLHGFESDKPVIIWMEPEKYTLVPFLDRAVGKILDGSFHLVIPRRPNLDSYPPYQNFSELRANHELGNITGRGDLDLMFGTRVMSRGAVAQFLEFTGTFAGTHGLDDNWGILFFPILSMLERDFNIGSTLTGYVHPPEQTELETDSPEMNAKRDTQREALVSGMAKAAAIYDFHPRL